MIRHFGTLEADFEREYRIFLADEVWWMSWRRFMMLLRGLSTASGWMMLARAKTKGGTRKLIKGRQVDDYFSSLGG